MIEAGNVEAALRDVARERLAGGSLPLDAPVRTWGGAGTGAACALCDRVTTPAEIEFRLDYLDQAGEHSIRLHRRCHAVWDAERRPPVDKWTSVTRAVPPPNVRVEARLRLAEGRTIILDIRRETRPGHDGVTWINATNGEPLRASWAPVEWRLPTPLT